MNLLGLGALHGGIEGWKEESGIRDDIAGDPSVGLTEIDDALTKKGIAVFNCLVALVKYRKPAGVKVEAEGRPPAKPFPGSQGA